MARHKPFSKTEMKILIYNKVKGGMTYENARKQVAKDIEQCIQASKQLEKDTAVAEGKNGEKKFKEEFRKLKHGNSK